MKKNASNSDRISENHISGIHRVVKLDMVINGKPVSHFKHFRLQQSTRRHHYFELILAHDSLAEVQNHNLEEARQFLGKRLTITFRYKEYENESPERTFAGVITKIAFSQEKMTLGNIVLKGQSPTILMDAAPHTQSFGGEQAVNTSIIADKIIKEALGSEKFDFRVETQNKSYINYSAQYCETHYNYLTRIAEAYGEQFYYDGEILHFGKLPPSEKPIQLIEGSNVTDTTIELKAVHTKPEYFAYNSSSHSKMLGVDHNIKHLGDLSAKSYELNHEIFKTRSLVPAPINANMFLDVDDSQKSARGSIAVEVFTVSGKTTVPFLYPGCVVDLSMRKPDSSHTAHFTTLMITEANHEIDARGYYTGSFEAIAEGTGFMPKPDFITPKAEPQIATVISNVDPLNQGRIKVRFDWQVNDTTHFIRMMSPDAGGTDAVSQNRGFVAIPEVGDQVMVGFEYHHPDFPFAMGGMFHGKVGLGGGGDNHLKSIQTRSGIKVLMNDAQRSVTIEDPSGNVYFMDGQGNINVTAPNKITMNATNVEINANNNFDINVGNNMTSTVGNTVLMNYLQKTLMNTPVMLQTVSELFHAQATKTIINTENELFIQAKEANVAGTQKLFIHSDQNTIVNSKGVIDMHGKRGNNQTNKPQNYKYIPVYVDERCLVSFRPKNDWEGKGYGFDWIRVGDTKIAGDINYGNRIGKYRDSNGALRQLYDNDPNLSPVSFFVNDKTEFVKLMSLFNPHVYTIKNKKGKKIKINYCVPWLSLYPQVTIKNIKQSNGKIVPKEFVTTYKNTAARLRVIIDIKKKPEKLTLEYENKFFNITHAPFPLTIRKHELEMNITCLKEFATDQSIKVIATYKDSQGKEELSLAGKLKVAKNKNRYKAKIVFIEVWTNIGNGIKKAQPTGRDTELTQYMNQALINPHFENKLALKFHEDVDSITKQKHNRKTNFNNTLVIVGSNAKKRIENGWSDEIYNFLNNELYKKYDKTKNYRDYYKIYFINESAGGLYGIGRSVDKDLRTIIVYAKGFNDSTVAHETLHSLGLYHSFDNDGEFTLEQNITDNIMDYSDMATPPVPVISIYHWQWKKAQKRCEKE
ncbi:phage baseplate assembly protein V [Chryseobacterium sp. Mn2064]|uniref:phage baseplate assembly protein V n=1 Tax=Chryseobacterium sp. Mn2064 TaxID=3395263 RepID=UPI003BD5F266